MDPKMLVDKIDEKSCLDFLSSMVRHKSYSQSEGERELARYMAGEKGIGLDAELQPFDEGRRFNAIGRLKGSGGGKSLLFNGHLDTNPVTEGWTVDPWGGLVDDKFIYGIGVSNMKAGDAAYFCAVKTLMDAGVKLKGDVILTFVVGELQGGVGTLAAIHGGIKADYFVNSEPLMAFTMRESFETSKGGISGLPSIFSGTAALFRELLPEAAFIPLPDIGYRLRRCKSEAEIALLRQAAAIADKAMAVVAEQTAPGMTVREAAAIAAGVFLREGTDTGEVGPIVKSRGDQEFLHGAFQDGRLSEGDILHVELIPKVANYSARMMRPILVGDPSDEQIAGAQKLIAIQDRQIAAMQAGAWAHEVDAIMREDALSSGLRKEYTNVTGYTLGLVTRTPRTSDFSSVLLPTARWKLQEGMVFHVYTSAHGLAFSETVVVTKGGGIRLTQTPRTFLTGFVPAIV